MCRHFIYPVFLLIILYSQSLPQNIELDRKNKSAEELELANRAYDKKIFKNTCLDFGKTLNFSEGTVILDDDGFQQTIGTLHAYSLKAITGKSSLFLFELETYMTMANNSSCFDILIVKIPSKKEVSVVQHFRTTKLLSINSNTIVTGVQYLGEGYSFAERRIYLEETTWKWNGNKFVQSGPNRRMKP